LQGWLQVPAAFVFSKPVFMKKYYLLLLLSAFSAVSGSAQEHRCYTDEIYRKALEADPSLATVRQQLEQFTSGFVRNLETSADYIRNKTSGGTPTYIIPVVIHVVHQYGPENISDAQVLDCIRLLNEDFRKLNPDTSLIVPALAGVAADCEIEFRLATIDPNGNCTNGIDRIYSDLTYQADDNAKLNPWPSNKYLNIWSVNSLQNSGAAAYAYYPGTAPPGADGILSRHDYIGSIGSSAASHRHTITHEVGHCLNLAHVWGSTNSPGVACGDDNVADTPETEGWTSCNLSASVCNPPIIENVQNMMEYSYCSCMFTFGQRNRMFAALNSNAGGRNQLVSPANLSATGALASPPPVCAPVADFYAVKRSTCAGRPIYFTDQTWNGHPTSWNWSFPGGTPSASVDSNPVVVYNTPGTYDATLTVTNAGGTDVITRSGFIRVSSATGVTTPILISFDLPSDFPGAGGWVNDADADGFTWTRFTNAGAGGSATSIKMDNYRSPAGRLDEYITPPFDITNMTAVKFRFQVANAQRNSNSSDQLRVFTSTNCGETWTPTPYNRAGASLATAGVVSGSFTPASSAQWRQDSINLNGLAPRSNVRLKFQNISDGGNNTYLDEFQIIGNTTNLDETEEVTLGFRLYPNPSSGNFFVQFKLNAASDVRLHVRDITGREVYSGGESRFSPDSYELPLQISGNGTYLVHLSVDGREHIRRLVVAE
jgi:PKD repeat protein